MVNSLNNLNAEVLQRETTLQTVEENIRKYEEASKSKFKFVITIFRDIINETQYKSLIDIRATLLHPSNAELYIALADKCKSNSDNYHLALKYVEKGLELNPTHSYGLFLKAHLLYLRVELDRSLQVLEQSIKIEPSALAFELKGAILYNKEKYLDSLSCYNLAHKLSPSWKELLQRRAFNFYMLKRYQEALDDFNQIVTLNDQSFIKSQFIYGKRGELKVLLGLTEEAYSDLTQELTLNPKHEKSLLLRGEIAFAKNDFKQVIDDFMNVSGELTFVQTWMLIISYKNLQKYYEALFLINPLICKEPQNKKLLLLRIEICEAIDLYSVAYGDYVTLLKMEPQNEELMKKRNQSLYHPEKLKRVKLANVLKSSTHAKFTEDQIEGFVSYIELLKLEPEKYTYLNRSRTGLARTIVRFNGQYYIHLNRLSLGDSLIGGGASRRAKLTILYNTFQVLIRTTSLNIKLGRNEVAYIQALKNIENVVRVVFSSVIVSKKANAELHQIIMPYYPNGSLDDHILGLSLETQKRVILIILKTMREIHQKCIVHRDLKPANILMDENNNPHISDFELAANCGDFGGCKGTPDYMAPEIYVRSGFPRVSRGLDVYSLGVLLDQFPICQTDYRLQNLIESMCAPASERIPYHTIYFEVQKIFNLDANK